MLAQSVEMEEKMEGDFRYGIWGMYKYEVQPLETADMTEPDPEDSDDVAFYRTVAMELETVVAYHFDEMGCLNEGVLYFDPSYDEFEEYLRDFRRIKGILTEEFGPSKEELLGESDEIWEVDPSEYELDSYDQAVLNDDLIYYCEWITERTSIGLALEGGDDGYLMEIVYRDINAIDEIDAEYDEAEADSAISRLQTWITALTIQKKILLFFMVVLIGLVGFFGIEYIYWKIYVEPEFPIAEIEDGFRSGVWGVTPEQIKESETANLLEDLKDYPNVYEMLIYQVQYLGYEMEARYVFDENVGLYFGGYSIELSEQSNIEEYQKIRKELSEEYGEPIAIFSDNPNQIANEEVSTWSDDIPGYYGLDCEMIYGAVWEDNDTRIQLLIYREKVGEKFMDIAYTNI